MPVTLKKLKQKPTAHTQIPLPLPPIHGVLVPLRVMGIDISTATGVVVLEWDTKFDGWRTKLDAEISLQPLPKHSGLYQRMARWGALQENIRQGMEMFKPRLTAIEGYGYANIHSLATLVELGTMVRLEVAKVSEILEVAPTLVKKFVLGKGVGKKEQVILQVFKRWGYEANTNNIADAYVLAHIAAAHAQPATYPLTKPQGEVMKILSKKA